MGKRSSFRRRKHDDYQTPMKPVLPLLPFLRAEGISTYSEPCAGRGDLVDHLRCHGFTCVYQGDIVRTGDDALKRVSFPGDAIVTNPPWTRALLHPLITHFLSNACPIWLLFDADWAHTRQAEPYLPQCSHIVSVGRVKWIPGSKHTGKDNASWYRFDRRHWAGPHFFSQTAVPIFELMEEAA